MGVPILTILGSEVQLFAELPADSHNPGDSHHRHEVSICMEQEMSCPQGPRAVTHQNSNMGWLLHGAVSLVAWGMSIHKGGDTNKQE